MVGQLVLVGDVAEHDLGGAGGTAPHEAELVAQLPVLDAQFPGQQPPGEGDPVAGVVVDLGVGDDGVHVDAGQLQPDAGVGVGAGLLDLGEPGRPLGDLVLDDADLGARDGREDRPVVERAEPPDGQLS